MYVCDEHEIQNPLPTQAQYELQKERPQMNNYQHPQQHGISQNEHSSTILNTHTKHPGTYIIIQFRTYIRAAVSNGASNQRVNKVPQDQIIATCILKQSKLTPSMYLCCCTLTAIMNNVHTISHMCMQLNTIL